MLIAKFAYVILIGYLLGSIPFGMLISRHHAKVDVTKFGSGKTGATNVLRTAGTKAAAMVAIFDVMKGVMAVIIAGYIFGDSRLIVAGWSIGGLVAQILAALAAVAGHNWSMFLKFKGGRGVATYFGGLIALCPPAALVGGEMFALSAGFTRYVSLGSIVGTVGSTSILVPLTIFNGFPAEYLIYTLIGGIIVIYMHRDNIRRLRAGNERKLGEKAKAPNPPAEGIK